MQTALLCASTLLGAERSPQAVKEEKQSMASLQSLCCWSRKAKLWDGWGESKEGEGRTGRVTQWRR